MYGTCFLLNETKSYQKAIAHLIPSVKSIIKNCIKFVSLFFCQFILSILPHKIKHPIMNSSLSGSVRGRGVDFVASPPTDQQIQSIAIAEQEMEMHMEKRGKPNLNFVENAKNFSDGIKKLFMDLWLEYRQGQKTNDGKLVSSSKSKISSQLPEVCNLVTRAINSFTKTISEIFAPNPSQPTTKTLFSSEISFISQSIANYFDAVEDMIKQAGSTNNQIMIPSFEKEQLVALEKVISALLESQKEHIISARDMYMAYDEFLAHGNEEIDDDERSKKEKITNDQFNDQDKASKKLSEFFKSTLSSLLNTTIVLYGKQEKKVAPQFEQIVGYLVNQFDEIKEEEIPENSQCATCFFDLEYLQLSEMFYNLTTSLWKQSANIEELEEPVFGANIVDFVNIDTKRTVNFLNILDICKLYTTAGNLNDKTTAADLNDIIILLLQKKEEEIADLVEKESTNISGGIDKYEPESLPELLDTESVSSMSSRSTKATKTTTKTAASKKKPLSQKRAKDPIVTAYENEMEKLNQRIVDLVKQVFEVISSAHQTSDYIIDKSKEESEYDDKNDEYESIRNTIDSYSDIKNNISSTLYDHLYFLTEHIKELKLRSPKKSGAVTGATEAAIAMRRMKEATKAKADGASVYSGRSSVTSTSSFSMREAMNKVEAELHIARFAQLSAEELLIIALRNLLFLDIRNEKYNGENGQKELKKFIKNLNEFTMKYNEHLATAKDEASMSVNIQQITAIDNKMKQIQESPTELASAFGESFRGTIEQMLQRYFQKQAHYTEKLAIKKKEIDTQIDELFTEKEEVHIPQLVVFEKKYIIKEEREKQRSVPEAEKLMEEAKKLAATGAYEEAQEKKEKAFEIEENVIEERLAKVYYDKEKEYNELIKTQQQELAQIESLAQRLYEREEKSINKLQRGLKESLLPSIHSVEKSTIDVVTQCINSITCGSEASAKERAKKEKKTGKSDKSSPKDTIKKLFHSIIIEVLAEHNMTIEGGAIKTIKESK